MFKPQRGGKACLRKLYTVLALLMVAVTLISCGGGAQPAPTAAPAPTTAPAAAATEAPAAAATEAPAAEATKAPEAAAPAGNVKELTIWWAQWDPANYLQEIGNLYEQETGIKINVVQEPWGSYQNKVSAEWAARGTGFDMVVGDSQWIGQGVTEGHYVDMTDFLASNGLDRHRHRSHPEVLRRVPARLGQVLRLPDRGRRQRLGLPQGHRREPRRDEGLRGQVRLRLLASRPRTTRCSSTWPSSSTGPTPTRPCTARPSTPRRTTTPSPWASRTPSSPTAATGTRTGRSKAS